MARERARLGLTQAQLAEATETVSERSISDLESGVAREYRDTTLGPIERVFAWDAGDCRAIAHGELAEPNERMDNDLRLIFDAWRHTLNTQQKADILAIVEAAARRR